MLIPNFPFNYDKYFVPDALSPDCLGACFAMCARYWKDRRPKLNLPTTIEEWNKFLEVIHAVTPRGTSIMKLISNLNLIQKHQEPDLTTDEGEDESEYVTDVLESKTKPPLVISPFNFNSIEDSYGFLSYRTPIPLILVFDQSMAQNNYESGGHAVMLHSYDSKVQQKIYVIDPLRAMLRKPYPYDMDLFYNGWKTMSNLALAVYPYDEKVLIKTSDTNISSTMLDFIGEK